MKDEEIRHTRILCGRCQLRLAASTVIRPSHVVDLTGEIDEKCDGCGRRIGTRQEPRPAWVYVL